MRFAPSRTSALLWTASCLSLAGLVATASRVPISEGDDAFYASIARALPARESFDYLRFYGPVFFRTVSWSFSAFGFSVGAFRAVSLAGALLVAVAGVMLARALGADRPRQAWACALLLLSPEVGWAATAGRMDSLAVGLELLGLAFVVRGLATDRQPWMHGVVGGIGIAGAALTTPRTFPFVLAIVVAAATVVPLADCTRRRSASRTILIAGATSLILVGVWIANGAGGLRPWLRIMWAIATQQRDDVALLPGMRVLSFAWWRAVTPAVAILGGLALARARGGPTPHALAARFALVTAWITFVVTAAIFTMTFFFATYIVLPLFAVVLALSHDVRLPGRATAITALALLAFFGAVRAGKHVRSAVTWSARDSGPIEAFIAAHAPPGSIIVGPHYLYFFPAERAGSRYRTANQVSWADWTQWIPASERATPGARAFPAPSGARAFQGPSGARAFQASEFLLWPTDGDSLYGPLPQACAPSAAIATYNPPPDDLPVLSRLVSGDPLRGYPRATLYRVTSHCWNEP